MAEVLLALGGHTLNATLIQRGRGGLAILVTVLACAIWISSHVLTAERYMSVGTFDDFYAHRTVPLPVLPESEVLSRELARAGRDRVYEDSLLLAARIQGEMR